MTMSFHFVLMEIKMSDKHIVEVRGAWNINKSENYLRTNTFPIRLATLTKKGFPLVTSLWYLYDNGFIWCAVQEGSEVYFNIKNECRCGFEIGPNDSPYMGIRGQGNARLVPERGREKLTELIRRYLDKENDELANWLLGRSETETAIVIEPLWFFTWDYSDRMS